MKQKSEQEHINCFRAHCAWTTDQVTRARDTPHTLTCGAAQVQTDVAITSTSTYRTKWLYAAPLFNFKP